MFFDTILLFTFTLLYFENLEFNFLFYFFILFFIFNNFMSHYDIKIFSKNIEKIEDFEEIQKQRIKESIQDLNKTQQQVILDKVFNSKNFFSIWIKEITSLFLILILFL